jgi:hypothetical protein
MKIIFLGIGLISNEDKVLVTLSTAFCFLKLDNDFNIYPTCPDCHGVYPHDMDAEAVCLKCKTPLFKFWDKTRTLQKPKPVLQCPQKPISDQLLRMLNHTGFESAGDEWRFQEATLGAKTCVMDGKVWKTLQGPDGKPFFDNSDD